MFSWIISGLKICRKGVAYAPIRAHYHRMITIFWGSTRRARPHRVPGNSARRARAAADAGIASWSSWCARTRSKAGFAARCAAMFQRPAHRNSVVRDEGASSRHRGDPADPADTAAAIPRAHHGTMWCELGLQHSVDYIVAMSRESMSEELKRLTPGPGARCAHRNLILSTATTRFCIHS